MVGVHVRKFNSKTTHYTQQIIDFVLKRGGKIMLFPVLEARTKVFNISPKDQVTYSRKALKSCEVVICLGGDGTILDALTYVRDFEVPLLGINIGRLGFLSPVSTEEIEEALTLFFSGQYSIDKRSLLTLKKEEDVFSGLNFGLNEFVILRKDLSAMIDIRCFVDGFFVGRFMADGFMVSTPTGSTAYALSCGGSIISPRCHNFLLTPINPHNLHARGLTIPDSSLIRLEIESHSRWVLASLDARAATVRSSKHFAIEKAPFYAHFVQLAGAHFFNTLREKLRWGVDIRK